MPKKCVLILLDGLGDRSYAAFGHRTPLQAARTPHLDRLAALGANGSYHAASLGQALPSENAHFALFGYDPADFPGRGALEALGSGVDLAPDEVALLAHFVTLRPEGGRLLLEEDLPKASREEAEALAAAADGFEAKGLRFSYRPTKGLFGVVVAAGGASPLVTDSNPMRNGRFLSDILPLHEAGDDPAAARTAKALRAYLLHLHRTLPDLPLNRGRAAEGKPLLNGLVTQRAGRLRPVRPFTARFGLRGLSIASGAVFAGLARYLGLDFQKAAEGDDPGADLAARLRAARAALADHDFIHVHTKAPDEAGHTKDPVFKKEVIESLDRGLGEAVGPLLEDPEALVAVTSDHSTPSCGNLVHSGESVPLVLCGEGVRRDRVEAFDEVSAAAGCLGQVRGLEFMRLVLNHLDLARLEGVRDCPEPIEYWPGPYAPFPLD